MQKEILPFFILIIAAKNSYNTIPGGKKCDLKHSNNFEVY
jgi:hypothetical protein